jgi:hypothetical protein
MQGTQSHLRLDFPRLREVYQDRQTLRLWESEVAMDRLRGLEGPPGGEEDPLVSSACIAEEYRPPYPLL